MNIFKRVACKILPKKIRKKIELQELEKAGFTHGKNFKMYGNCEIDGNYAFLISVGKNVSLAPNVRILAHDAGVSRTGGGSRVGIISIGNNVFIGAESVVLCNVRIGDNVVIGAGSVVTKDIPSNSIAAGNPARVICTFDEFKQKHQANRESGLYPIFKGYPTSEEEKKAMRDALKDTYGYI